MCLCSQVLALLLTAVQGNQAPQTVAMVFRDFPRHWESFVSEYTWIYYECGLMVQLEAAITRLKSIHVHGSKIYITLYYSLINDIVIF